MFSEKNFVDDPELARQMADVEAPHRDKARKVDDELPKLKKTLIIKGRREAEAILFEKKYGAERREQEINEIIDELITGAKAEGYDAILWPIDLTFAYVKRNQLQESPMLLRGKKILDIGSPEARDYIKESAKNVWESRLVTYDSE